MAVRAPQAFWPGVTGFISCSYTVSHGSTPGVAALEIPEQDVSKIRPYGTLIISDSVNSITLNRCQIVGINWNQADGGRTIVLTIADRRWMWQYGYVQGNWNQIDPYPDPALFPPGEFVAAGGPYVPGTYRLASDLISDCLDGMNEEGYLITNPPNIPIPVQWAEEVPAQALQALTDQLGYRLIFRPLEDSVLVAPMGMGKTLPDNLPFITNHVNATLPTRPNTIQLIGGDTLFHDVLLLEAVGIDADGTMLPINQLSYAPKNGWSGINPASMKGVQSTFQLSEQEAIDLAKKCIWKMFRVKMVDVATQKAPGPNVGGYGLITDRAQIVLQPASIGVTKNPNGQPDTSPPFVTGSVYLTGGENAHALGLAAGLWAGNTNQFLDEKLPWTPQIDVGKQIVTFGRQMYRNEAQPGGNLKVGPPILYLNTSFKIQSIIGQLPVKFYFGDKVDGVAELGCPPQALRHPELVLVQYVIRDSKTKAIKTIGTNIDDLTAAATYYLNAANAVYQGTVALDRTYAGIWPINPDGAIRQVTWEVGGGRPATTRASQNCEHAFYLPSFAEKRQNDKSSSFASRAEREAKAQNGFGNFGSDGQNDAGNGGKFVIAPRFFGLTVPNAE